MAVVHHIILILVRLVVAEMSYKVQMVQQEHIQQNPSKVVEAEVQL